MADGHVDCCMAPYWSASNVFELTRALVIFAPEDPTTGLWNALPASEMPHLYEPYGAMVSAETRDQHPDRYVLWRDSFAEAQNLAPFADTWSPEQCSRFIDDYLAMLADYKGSMEQDLAEM